MHTFYKTHNYEWSHHKQRTREVFEFPKDDVFVVTFSHSLHMATKDNQKINPFLLLSQSYVGKFEEIYEGVDDPLGGEHDSNKIEQSKDCLYLNLICAVRHVVLGEYSHTADFSCFDKDMPTKREV